MIRINGYSHPCMPKEYHQMYDLLRLQEIQDEKDKKEEAKNEIKVEFSLEEISIKTNTKKLQEKQDEKDKKEEAKNEIKVEFSAEKISIKTNTKMDIMA